MTTSTIEQRPIFQRRVGGGVILGGLLLVVGTALNLTIIGMVIGVPMVVAGLGLLGPP